MKTDFEMIYFGCFDLHILFYETKLINSTQIHQFLVKPFSGISNNAPNIYVKQNRYKLIVSLQSEQ